MFYVTIINAFGDDIGGETVDDELAVTECVARLLIVLETGERIAVSRCLR